MKIAFGMIVFEGDYVLKQCLQQVYPFASQILIAEGPVSYWQRQGKTTSEDKTNEIIDKFPDPEKKIKIIHGKFLEKDDQCNAYIKFMDDDTDYLWNLDSDEVYKTEDLKKMISFLETEKPTSVGIRSCTFYGGIDHYLTGFELNIDNFRRIFRVSKGANWLTHRPPTINYPPKSGITPKHIDSETLYLMTGIQMYHYSYVFPEQVKNKVGYYKSDISKESCIDDYFYSVYYPWLTSNEDGKMEIENKFDGVHEFKPHVRGPCRTAKYTGSHPEAIEKSIPEIKDRIKNEILKFKNQEKL